MRFFVNVIYTFKYRYNLASGALPKTKHLGIYAELPVGSKFHFFKWKIYSFLLIKNLKFKEFEYLIYYVKFEM